MSVFGTAKEVKDGFGALPATGAKVVGFGAP
jgi:hypothetical protein